MRAAKHPRFGAQRAICLNKRLRSDLPRGVRVPGLRMPQNNDIDHSNYMCNHDYVWLVERGCGRARGFATVAR